jgi:hypothetical protein
VFGTATLYWRNIRTFDKHSSNFGVTVWVGFDKDDDDDDDKYIIITCQALLYKPCQLNIMILSFLNLEEVQVNCLCSNCVQQSARCSYM